MGAPPPGVEEGPSEDLSLSPNDVPLVGNMRVLVGEYGGARNPLPPPSPMAYLDVELEPDRTTPRLPSARSRG